METKDCLIVGAGPAGLTAAIYLARFNRSVVIVEDGCSRAATIPCTRNHAGYPGGIAGADLLERMSRQARDFGVTIQRGTVRRLARQGDLFVASWEEGELMSRTVLLATGVINHRPDMVAKQHDAALAAGLLRYCPICDGYEVTDACVGVLGTGQHGHAEAMFLRMYTRDVTLIAPHGPHDLDGEVRDELAAAGIALVDGPCGALTLADGAIHCPTASGVLAFDSLYPALGSKIRSELAAQLGAAMSEDGCLTVDAHQRTTIAGLYAAGDVVQGLDQISHAMGAAGIAATTIRNDLAQHLRLWR